MSPALWLLLGLQWRGWLRYLGQNLRSLRGLMLMLIGLAVFLPWLLAVLIKPVGGGIEPTTLARYGPAVLLLYCVGSVLFSGHEKALYFTPAEVQMLFAGPFGRREVLAYKLLLTLMVSVPATLLMGAVVRIRDGWPPAVLTGLFLISVFMQLFTITLGLAAGAIGAQLFNRSRKVLGVLALLVVLGILLQAGWTNSGWHPRRVAQGALETELWRVISLPVRAFFDIMAAEQFWPDLARPLLIGILVNVALVVFVFALDQHYQEASASASMRVFARLQRLRGRSVGAETEEKGRQARLVVPTLPWWGGIGPILWRQLTTAMRGIGRLVLVLVLLGSLLAPFLGQLLDQNEVLAPTLIILGAWLSIFVTTLVPFDFRGDIDRIATLKSLPIAPWRLVIGQLLTPALILSVMQWLALGVALVFVPENAEMVLTIAVFVPPFNFVLVALENLLFLLFPVRVMAATPGDFQALGRNVLLSLGKVVGLSIIGGVALVVGLVVALLTGNLTIGIAAAWPLVTLSGAALVPLVALAFGWFDVGRDTPA